MTVSTKNPKYIENESDYIDIQKALLGEREIKKNAFEYLPPTSGMLEAKKQGLDPQFSVYDGYKKRAQYPEWVKDTVRSMNGLVSGLNPNIELNNQNLEVLRENATDDGFSLFELFIRCTVESAKFGRYGILTDFDANGMPYFALYDAISIINWKSGTVLGRKDLTLITLKEEHIAGDDEFDHDVEIRYRVLDLDESGFYRVRIFDEDEKIIETIEPKMGSRRLEFIPFVFGGSVNNSSEPNPIPLMTMAKCAIKSYQLSADYFQSLYMTAHPQPYVTGIDTPKQIYDETTGQYYDDPNAGLKVTGAIALWELPEGASVGYLEISGTGIQLTKQEMESQRNAAAESGAKVIDIGSNESGVARIARQQDQHATLYTIVQAASNAIQQSLRYVALWLGLNETEIVFSVPLEFSQTVEPTVLTKLYEMAMAGKISFETVWVYVQTGKVVENTYDIEMQKLENEQSLLPLQRATV